MQLKQLKHRNNVQYCILVYLPRQTMDRTAGTSLHVPQQLRGPGMRDQSYEPKRSMSANLSPNPALQEDLGIVYEVFMGRLGLV